MSAPWMPPLPAPDYVQEIPPRFYKDERFIQFFYTADQMRRAQADAARAALEQAAKVCESRQTPGTGSVAILNGAADAIRALAKEVQR